MKKTASAILVSLCLPFMMATNSCNGSDDSTVDTTGQEGNRFSLQIADSALISSYDSLEDKSIPFLERLEVAKRLVYSPSECNNYSAIVYLLHDKASLNYSEEIGGYKDESEDHRARLFTYHFGGTMCSGESYIQYIKDNGDITVKMVAYSYECDGGGVCFPSYFKKIKNDRKGYRIHGVFSFSSNSEVYHNDELIPKSFLESDMYILPHK